MCVCEGGGGEWVRGGGESVYVGVGAVTFVTFD